MFLFFVVCVIFPNSNKTIFYYFFLICFLFLLPFIKGSVAWISEGLILLFYILYPEK